MADPKADKPQPDPETDKRYEETLKRMLATKPKHQAKKPKVDKANSPKGWADK